MIRPVCFRLIAAICFSIGLYHLAALSIPAIARFGYPAEYPAARHLIFIAIDFTMAYLFLVRPRWLIWPSLVLAAQVVSSHGSHAWQVLTQRQGIEWQDLAVVVFALASLAALYSDRHYRSKQLTAAETGTAVIVKTPPSS